jgi:DNA-binding response OmpR family regulator
MVLKALVVDDDKMILDILEYILESDGYEITRTTDVGQAIKVLNLEFFDLVVTDLQMGPTSGLNVIRKTKDINPNTIVIMITGSCDSLDEIEAFHQGADDYLLKPFSPNDLLARIHFQKSKQFFTSALTLDSEQRAGKLSG